MTKNYRTIKQLLVLALLTSIGTVGCSRSGESSNDEPKTATTNTATSSQRDSSSETMSPSEPVSAPKTSLTEAAVENEAVAVAQIYLVQLRTDKQSDILLINGKL